MLKGNCQPLLIMLYDITDSADIGSKGISNNGVGDSTTRLNASQIPNQGKQNSVTHGNSTLATDPDILTCEASNTRI
jgi:hypothetical protein